jgi:hypothetical protein
MWFPVLTRRSTALRCHLAVTCPPADPAFMSVQRGRTKEPCRLTPVHAALRPFTMEVLYQLS